MDNFSLTLCVISFLCLAVGTPLNILALAYFTRNPTRTLANCLFIVISAIDGLLCFSMLHHAVLLAREVDPETAKESITCIAVSWIWNILSRLSLFLTSVLSVTRAVSLCRPFSNIPTRPIVVLVVAELVYLLLYECSPSFTSHRVPVYHYGSCDWSVSNVGTEVPYQMCYSIAYFSPLILTIGSSTASFCLLRRNQVKFCELRGSEASTYHKQCFAANTIFILVIIYALCNLPYAVVLFVIDIEYIMKYKIRAGFFKSFLLESISLGSVYLVAINAALTPLVFLLRINEFRLFIKRKTIVRKQETVVSTL